MLDPIPAIWRVSVPVSRLEFDAQVAMLSTLGLWAKPTLEYIGPMVADDPSFAPIWERISNNQAEMQDLRNTLIVKLESLQKGK